MKAPRHTRLSHSRRCCTSALLFCAFGGLLLPTIEASARCGAPERCLRAGELDPTFGVEGAVYVDVGNGSSRGAMDMVVLADGSVVMGGSSTLDGGANHDATLVRFTSSGTLDPAFGSNGVVRVDLGSGNAIVQSVLEQPDGKILAAGGRDPDPSHVPGNTTGYLPQEAFLLRLNGDGSVDVSFGEGGRIVSNTAPLYRRYDRILLQPDGMILAVGLRAAAGSRQQYFVERYDASGTLDTSFGAGGVALVNADSSWATYERAGAVLTADGSVVVATSAFEVDALLSCALARLDANGNLDPSFGGDGHVILEKSLGDVCNLKAVTQQADGRILASGTFYGRGDDQTFALMRLNDDGSSDESLRRRGRSLTRVALGSPVTVTSWAVTTQNDGAILQAGSRGGGEMDLTRHLANGRPDRRFGRHGLVRIGRPFGVRTTVFDGAHAVAVLPDGRLLVGGNPGHAGTFALARVLGRRCAYNSVALDLACD